MSGNEIGRRDFFRRASAYTVTAAAFGFGKQALPACRRGGDLSLPSKVTAIPMPVGNLGNLKVSRLIGGHNLACFQNDGYSVGQYPPTPHPADKILETFASYEGVGVNTAFLRITDQMVEVARRYVKERGGRLQWIAQLGADEKVLVRGLDIAMSFGVHAAYIRGMEGDRYAPEQMDLLGKAIETVKSCRIPIGLGGHNVQTMMTAEAAGLPVDFYVKTFNDSGTSMSGESTPRETAAFFAKVEKPWVALRVFGPGRFSARDGIHNAFADGADFVSAGAFDFQIANDARLVRELLAGDLPRTRPWRA